MSGTENSSTSDSEVPTRNTSGTTPHKRGVYNIVLEMGEWFELSKIWPKNHLFARSANTQICEVLSGMFARLALHSAFKALPNHSTLNSWLLRSGLGSQSPRP